MRPICCKSLYKEITGTSVGIIKEKCAAGVLTPGSGGVSLNLHQLLPRLAGSNQQKHTVYGANEAATTSWLIITGSSDWIRQLRRQRAPPPPPRVWGVFVLGWLQCDLSASSPRPWAMLWPSPEGVRAGHTEPVIISALVNKGEQDYADGA